MAAATPSPTPNPDALKFELDVTLPAAINYDSPEAATGHPFAAAVMGVDGVASVFGVNDFVTITRRPEAEWDPIIEAVRAAAAEHL
jgi:hypothetical protein